jgi:acetylornithine deacetylase/succinyl-diaminopimelate desuccinylase-like protein
MNEAHESGPVEWFASHEATALVGLNQFLAIPSVSTKAEHRPDVARCAEWLAGELRRIGIAVEVHATAGHPVVMGEWRGAGRGAPTLLVYGHYDVQPPDPLEQWRSPPFVGTLRDGRLYARGAADDKGQLWIHLKALEACLVTRGTLPVNVVLLLEGEEEVGSTSLPGFLAAHRERLACDYIVISDTMMHAPGVPNILASMRGLAYFEIFIPASTGEWWRTPQQALPGSLPVWSPPAGASRYPASTMRSGSRLPRGVGRSVGSHSMTPGLRPRSASRP